MRLTIDIPDAWVAEMVAAKADAGEPFSRRAARRITTEVANITMRRWWDGRHHWPVYRQRTAPSVAEIRAATIIPVSAWGEAEPPAPPRPEGEEGER